MYWPAALVVLNTFDGLATLYGVKHGYVYEANPCMAWALGHGAPAFMALKTLLILLPAVFLSRMAYRGFAGATWALRGAVGIYAAMAVWHVTLYVIAGRS